MSRRIANRYEILESIDQGSMGIVYRVNDLLSGGILALKQVILSKESFTSVELNITSSVSSESALRMAITKEFQTLASLRHPNIISVLDYGFDDQGQPYFTMPLLANPQTITVTGQNAPLSIQIDYLIQTLQALAYLHRREILHRDLKPENVLVVDGQVHVLDFGLSVERGEDQQRAGTIAYMSPEMIVTGQASERSDLYTVGVLAYEMLMGEHPFKTDTAHMLHAILNEEVDIALLPELVRPIIAQLLAKSPEDRFQNAQEAILALSHARGKPIPEETDAIRESYLQASRFVGRKDELKLLTSALEQATSGHGSLWLIGGESGIGKSRLLDELRIRALVKGASVLHGQVSEEHGFPYQLWREPLRRLMLITDINDLEASVLSPLVPDISTLLGREVPEAPLLKEEASQRLLLTIAALFRKAAKESPPLVLILDDLQWAVESLDPLIPLVRMIPETPMLIVGAYRTEERPHLPEEIPGAQAFLLDRFTPEDIETLSLSMLGNTGKQPHVLHLLQEETEGNAFFIVETVRALAEEAGTLDKVGLMTLPASVFAGGVQQVIGRRLRQIPEQDRPLLKLAAVAGRLLDLSILKKVRPEARLRPWLTLCTNVAILSVQENNYQFAHDKLREALIANLTDDERSQFNLQVAQALEQMYPNDPEYAGQLTVHWQRAGETDKAVHYAEIAGKYAASKFANQEAIQFFSQALDLTSKTNITQRYQLLLARENLYQVQGMPALQAQDLAELEALEDHMGKEEKAEIALRRSNHELVTSDYLKAIESAKIAIELSKNPHIQTTGYLRWGRSCWRAGDNDQAYVKLTKALEIAESAHLYDLMGDVYRLLALVPRHVNTHEGIMNNMERALQAYRDPRAQDRSGEAWALNNIGTTAYYQGHYHKARVNLEESVNLFQKIGDKRGEGQALYNMGHLFWILGAYDQAWKFFQQALRTWRESGSRRGESSAYRGLGMVAHHEGDYQDSLKYLQLSLDISVEINHRQGEGLTLCFLGHTLAALEKDPEAIQTYQRSLELWIELSVPGVSPDSRAGLARVYLHQGELKLAKIQVDKILDALAIRDLIFPEELFRIYHTCYLVLLGTQDSRAEEFLNWTYEQLQKHAASIQDESLYDSFLKNVPWHRTIQAFWEGKRKG